MFLSHCSHTWRCCHIMEWCKANLLSQHNSSSSHGGCVCVFISCNINLSHKMMISLYRGSIFSDCKQYLDEDNMLTALLDIQVADQVMITIRIVVKWLLIRMLAMWIFQY